MSTRESASPSTENEKKNKPKASRLRQQRLPAWQPILTASTVIPSVIAIGVIFIPIGIALFLASESVKEYKIDYTDCDARPGSVCHLQMNVTEDMEGDVYIYYYLENFYQNHRRYVKSRNDKQYLGNILEVSDCEPYDKANDSVTGQLLPIAPCGAIANSLFNDTYDITFQGQKVPTTTEGVLWDIDKDKKFKNPTGGPNLCESFKGTTKPPNWPKAACETGEVGGAMGFENVDFIVWMRTAALPNFRKLWRIVDKKGGIPAGKFAGGLPKGIYDIQAHSNYPVTPFHGRKAIIFSTTSWAGGKNSFLGIAYLVVGCLAILLAIVFIIIHVKFGHSITELSTIAPNGN